MANADQDIHYQPPEHLVKAPRIAAERPAREGGVDRVQRSPRPHSLANYRGLTPGCRNSGENNQRLGSITKAGSSMARWLLAQVAHQALRKGARMREGFTQI